jgi:hypothetical protein
VQEEGDPQAEGQEAQAAPGRLREAQEEEVRREAPGRLRSVAGRGVERLRLAFVVRRFVEAFRPVRLLQAQAQRAEVRDDQGLAHAADVRRPAGLHRGRPAEGARQVRRHPRVFRLPRHALQP